MKTEKTFNLNPSVLLAFGGNNREDAKSAKLLKELKTAIIC